MTALRFQTGEDTSDILGLPSEQKKKKKRKKKKKKENRWGK